MNTTLNGLPAVVVALNIGWIVATLDGHHVCRMNHIELINHIRLFGVTVKTAS